MRRAVPPSASPPGRSALVSSPSRPERARSAGPSSAPLCRTQAPGHDRGAVLVWILARLLHTSDEAPMSRIADIIPISSRKPRTASVGADASLEARTRRPAWIVLSVIVSLMMLGAALSFAESRPRASIAHLSMSNRASIFRRAYDDLRETCVLPEATSGPVQDHCRSAASFVLLFP